MRSNTRIITRIVSFNTAEDRMQAMELVKGLKPAYSVRSRGGKSQKVYTWTTADLE